MTTIQIHGTIVDAWFDHPFFAADIEAGVITPVSRFRAALADALAADGETVEIEINSPGGDVFAGTEMLAAIQDAGERVERIVVGGLAASMAANIALMAGRPLAVHTNSLLYFHSASSIIWGGPGAHADEAELLNKINAPMIARLIAAGFDEARVREGFAEGRNFVVDAGEAGEVLRAEVIGAEAAAPAPADAAAIERIQHPAAELSRLADYTATLANVARLAAWAPDAVADADADDKPADEKPAAEPAAEAGETPAAEPAAEPSPSSEPAAGATGEETPSPASAPAHAPAARVSADGAAPSSSPATRMTLAELESALDERDKQVRAVQSASAKKIHELTASLEAARAETAAALSQRDDAIRERDDAQAKLADLDTKLAQITAALAAERTARADLVADVLAPESDQEIPAGATPHADRLAALRSLDERVAYAKAHAAELAAERARR